MLKLFIKVFIYVFITTILIACNMKDAIDFEDDKNRIISEQLRDTFYINDTTFVEVRVVVHDTIRDTIRDTIYINQQRETIKLINDKPVTFTEKWINAQETPENYKRIFFPSVIIGDFLLNINENGKIVFANIFFDRGEYVSDSRIEWLSDLTIGPRFLKYETKNTLSPFGQNLGGNNYFYATTKNKKNQLFRKSEPQNIVFVSFKEESTNRFNMIIEGTLIYNDKRPEFKEFYFEFELIIPLRYKE